MTAAARDLAHTATPFEGGAPVEACVVGGPEGWHTAWAHDGGRQKEAFGPAYATARAAAAAARYFNERSFGPAR